MNIVFHLNISAAVKKKLKNCTKNGLQGINVSKLRLPKGLKCCLKLFFIVGMGKAKKKKNSFRSPRASLSNLRVNVGFLKKNKKNIKYIYIYKKERKKDPLVFQLQKSM